MEPCENCGARTMVGATASKGRTLWEHIGASEGMTFGHGHGHVAGPGQAFVEHTPDRCQLARREATHRGKETS